ncbi:hypothetical protein [Haloarcula nitratireducens]|uniref:Uncharacterized protein n=1 Tax=Haloarcula nitratireducens TaxID=2487749 RepID=A0AAW4PDX6_9EURY|nr:hypothetical protein [Halomicroarcula nitratireducens]MBX0295871.1 hypothetical protein [Halomicroarcula nitratireducens]
MRLTVGGTTYEGRVVDLRTRAVSGAAIAAAVRGERCLPVISAPGPPTVYDYCGHVYPEMGFRTKTALAAAARSRGIETRHDGEIAELREQLASLDSEEPSLPPADDPVSESAIAALREDAATARGRLDARKTLGANTDDARRSVRETTGALSERETERTAAAQSRERRRDVARSYRDRRAERRRVADRLANRRRDARAALVDRLRGRFAAALDALPGSTPTDPFDASPVLAALSILRVARTDAPVVLEVDRFEHPTAAAAALDAPIVRC